MKFRPTKRPDQKYHTESCRKKHCAERKYIDPANELRAILAKLLRHLDPTPLNSLASVFSPKIPETELERDVAEARRLLAK